jgi:hypothetical protein
MNDTLLLLNLFIPIVIPLVPFLTIYLVGAILCIVRWRRHPRLSSLALFAFVVFLVRLVGESFARNLLMYRALDFGWDPATLGIYLGIVGACGIVLGIVAWVALLIALFDRRDWPIVMDVGDYKERSAVSDTAIQERHPS